VERAFGWLYRRLGRRYLAGIAVIEALSAMTIALGTVGILSLYVDMSGAQFARIVAFSEVLVLIAVAVDCWRMREPVRPLSGWLHGEKIDPAEAWQAAVRLPVEFVTRSDKQAVLLVAVPISAFATLELHLPFYSVAVLFLGGLVSIGYAAVLHFFYAESALAPVVRELAHLLPEDFGAGRAGVSLRWKLLGALPLINVITGVVVSGLSTNGRQGLAGLGVSVLAAVIVAFTLSLELTVLVSRSVLSPVRDLIRATERVKAGDLSASVPVTSGDELGALASGFNSMMHGLAERQALHDAFSSYVDPQLATRVLAEGARIPGEEVDVTVIFVDLRGFTSYAERAEAREVVAYVNEYLELTVPTLTRHGCHVNKFVGDGVLGVFGAPVHLDDHADRAVAAASELALAVERHFGQRLGIGVGINSGRVLAGTIGGGGKLDFTVIGDPVNVAARVEEMTRETGDVVLLTEATRRRLTAEPKLEPRGAIPLKGRSEPVPVFALLPPSVPIVQNPVPQGQGMPTGG
jgi:class 3 adenylate cyclase